MKDNFIPYHRVSTLDDLIRLSYQMLIDHGIRINPSRGEAKELSGVTFELTNPRARLSQSVSRGKIYSAIGELCWYLSGDDSGRTMDYYIKDYSKFNSDDPNSEKCVINGAYGPRLFGKGSEQFNNVYRILSKKPDSRQAIIQVFDYKDVLEKHVDVPCTCTLQFLLREDRLNLIVYMRSNDVYKGLPHDIFCFTMMQEIMSNMLEVNLGYYKHIVGSFHLYSSDEAEVNPYLNEGYYSTNVSMPNMPKVDLKTNIDYLLSAEKTLREKDSIDFDISQVNPYWRDLIRILLVNNLFNKKDYEEVNRNLSSFSNPMYSPYVVHRLRGRGG